jgi:hypothetical protein
MIFLVILCLNNKDFEPDRQNKNVLQQTLSAVSISDVYQKYFEDSFLRETEEFYRLEVTNFSNKSIIEYLEKVCPFSKNRQLFKGLISRWANVSKKKSIVSIHIFIHQHYQQ